MSKKSLATLKPDRSADETASMHGSMHNAATMHATLTLGPVTAARLRLEEQEATLTGELKALRTRQAALHRKHSSSKLRAEPEYAASCTRCDVILDELEAIAYALRHEFPLAVAEAETAAGGVAVLPTLA